MTRKRIKFTFVHELIKEPVIWKLAKQFDVITNIRRPTSPTTAVGDPGGRR